MHSLPVSLKTVVARAALARVLVVASAFVVSGARLQFNFDHVPGPSPLPGWMAGCWQAHTTTDTLEEYWMTPRAATMLGVSRLVHNDSVVIYEENRIEARGSRVVLVSEPSTDARKEYGAIELTAHTARFESTGAITERIRYERRADTLYVRYARRDSGYERGTEQSMTLASCPRG